MFVNIQNLTSFFFIFKIVLIQKYVTVCLDQLMDANSQPTQFDIMLSVYSQRRQLPKEVPLTLKHQSELELPLKTQSVPRSKHFASWL